jgi:hypothetical protein
MRGSNFMAPPLYFPDEALRIPCMTRENLPWILVLAPAILSGADWKAQIPRTWDDSEIATLEVPLAVPLGSPKHVPADYYYRIPVAPIYKSYPVYAPGQEPAGYLEWLKQQEPQILWDDAGKAPPLRTMEDWIKAGDLVFHAAVQYGGSRVLDNLRNPSWYAETGVTPAKDGTVPVFRYVIVRRGVVNVGQFSCAYCHSRLMPDGSVLNGAQGNFPLSRIGATGQRAGALGADPGLFYRAAFGVPWLTPDPAASLYDGQRRFDLPPGMNPRYRGSPLYPVQIPDLIGVKNRAYLDRTGLQRHRGIADLMRYAALNRGVGNGADALANHNGFIPADPPRFQRMPDPTTLTRYSDEQLYALALYLYSLKPPQNPNKFDASAAAGQKIFERERCPTCHTPPLYTNNKLTPAKGFEIPPEHRKTYDILPVSVGTDTNLTLRTRRGTGYYKVPSLKGLWYRGMLPHDGSCASLEDWFDPNRLRDDYVPTGWKGYGVERRAVPGHEFGLSLSPGDKKALIAFLKTL